MAMCNAMWDPYVTVGNFGPTLDPKNRISRTTSRSPDPAMTIPRERTRMQRVCSTVACPANSATDRFEIACKLSVIWCKTYLKKIETVITPLYSQFLDFSGFNCMF
jgi:hypothetical protein